jgi:hypothetical protein
MQLPHDWLHARGIDFHERVSWAVGWASLSPQNEMFFYREYNPSPEKMVTLTICREIIMLSGDYKFPINLVDPRAAISQPNTGLSTLDDLNRAFMVYKREGLGTGGYWQTWDTKSSKGRDAVHERLQNSKLVGKPFANRILQNGRESYLPTLWILDSCPIMIQSLKGWRYEEWANREKLITNDEKDKFQQKWSHFPMVLEGLLKWPGFSVGRYREQFVKSRPNPYAREARM